MSRIMISAAHKSSGKTTLSIGLCAALRAQGTRVAPFKKGPDYIDPLWLGEAAGHPCHNLDFYTQSDAEMLCTLGAANADLLLIEGNKGLHDGMAVDGSNSNAALAKLSRTPVVLVLDCRGTTRGIAPLVLGYQQFDREVKIAGVILNRVGGPRHESKLRAALAHYTEVPVLGAVYQDRHMQIVERHLGLMPSNEAEAAQQVIHKLADAIRAQVDLPAFLACAQQAAPLPECRLPPHSSAALGSVRIGVVRDAAFGFYYPGDLDALQAAGAHLVFIDALQDTHLPTVDGLFIGGGFPETKMQQLAANHALKADIRTAIDNALPVYAECGGLMYLGRRLIWDDQQAEMCAALPLDTRMDSRPQGRGYVHLQETGAGLWPLVDESGALAQFAAHEFHYSRVENLQPGLAFAYQVLRGYGIDGEHDGLVYKNTLASYTHLRDVRQNHWAARFVAFVRQQAAKTPLA